MLVRRRRTSLEALAALAALAALLTLTVPALADPGFVPIGIEARPLPGFIRGSEQRAFGRLDYLGGLDLTSDAADFGSLSGLDFTADGRLLAVADTGFWLTARLVEEDFRPLGLADAAMAPILGEGGAEANRKSDADAEGLRIATAGGAEMALVSFEAHHRLERFAAADPAHAIPTPMPLPPLDGLTHNRGIETVAVAPAAGPLGGATVIVSERADDGAGNIRGWILGGPKAGPFSIVRSAGFEVSDGAFLPNGDLLILERRFTFGLGVAMRMRQLPGAGIAPGAVVDGEALIEAGMEAEIDNMEGLAVRPLPSGEAILTLIADDNHNLLQRTVLLQFRWRP